MLDWIFTPEHREKRKLAKEQKAKEGKESLDALKSKSKSRTNNFYSGSSIASSIVVNNDKVIVNGVTLKPGTPEYEKYKTMGLKGLAKGMTTLDEAMKNMDEMFKEIF